MMWENGDEAMEVVVARKLWNDSVKSNTQSVGTTTFPLQECCER